MQLRGVSMDFHYGSSFGTRQPTAYETLLIDAIVGDGTLYTRQDMVEASWAAVDPDPRSLAEHQTALSQLPRRKLGPPGGRRNAQARPERLARALITWLAERSQPENRAPLARVGSRSPSPTQPGRGTAN